MARQPTLTMLRTILAGCFVFGGLLVAVALLSSTGALETLPPIAVGSTLMFLMLALTGAALWLFSPRGTTLLGLKSAEEHVRELEAAGLLESRTYRASRAFGVEEFEDEGLHYFVELDDGHVLYLNGQYLYEYEPISDDPEMNQLRRFPCTEFAVSRHKSEGYVVDMECSGIVFEPELVAPPFSRQLLREGLTPEDGAVLTDTSYDRLKAQCLGAGVAD